MKINKSARELLSASARGWGGHCDPPPILPYVQSFQKKALLAKINQILPTRIAWLQKGTIWSLLNYPVTVRIFFSTGKLQVSVSDNVKLMSWLPQNDILGHPKTRLFIGHAGINGILESTYHGVPMILAPFFGDQFYNANTMKQSGLAEVVNLWSMSSEEFVSLIQKVLSDPR